MAGKNEKEEKGWGRGLQFIERKEKKEKKLRGKSDTSCVWLQTS